MGPRFCKRGNCRRCSRERARAKRLQWGHAFVSVETCLSSPAWTLTELASMGPRFCKRGNRSSLPERLPPGTASMGPRFCKRGNRSSLPERLPPGTASMGPRFCKRGNHLRQFGNVFEKGLLQWGHAFVSVETAPSRVAVVARDMLQWGHAFVSVETIEVGLGGTLTIEASMGPRFCKRGNTCSARTTSRTSSCFNGATLL